MMRRCDRRDFLTAQPEWDTRSCLLTGRSQGGGLCLVGAGLDARVTGFVCAVPAMAELGAARAGRAPSWPRSVPVDEHDYGSSVTAPTLDGHGPVSDTAWRVQPPFALIPAITIQHEQGRESDSAANCPPRRVSQYFDAVNFCRRASCPAVVALGHIDTCVPPSTVCKCATWCRAWHCMPVHGGYSNMLLFAF